MTTPKMTPLFNGEIPWTEQCITCKIADAVTKSTQCKLCYGKEYYELNKKIILDKARDKYKNDPEFKAKRIAYCKTVESEKIKVKNREGRIKPGSRFSNGKHQAGLRNLKFEITKQAYFAIIAMPCYYCSDFFKNSNGESGVGLDRIDNELGYVVGNVLSCCGVCNNTRNANFTVEETKVMIKAAIKFRKKNK